MDRILAELAWRGGIADADVLRRVSRSMLERAVSEGRVVRVRRGRYVLPDVDAGLRVAHQMSGVRSHLTAALAHGWGVARPPARPSVIVPVGRRVEAHWRTSVDVRWRDLGSQERQRRLTDPLATVLDCARTLPFGEGLAVADSALRSGLIGHEELARASERAAGRGVVSLRRVARFADGRAANPFESMLRAIALQVPRLHLEVQMEIRDEHFVARVDLGDRRRRLVIEADSYQFHSSRQALARDIRRYNELATRAWTVLRFSYEDVFGDPAWVTHCLVRAAGMSRPTDYCRSPIRSSGRP